jgi:hypothetical protein
VRNAESLPARIPNEQAHVSVHLQDNNTQQHKRNTSGSNESYAPLVAIVASIVLSVRFI